jgi:hypothetical protein
MHRRELGVQLPDLVHVPDLTHAITKQGTFWERDERFERTPDRSTDRVKPA